MRIKGTRHRQVVAGVLALAMCGVASPTLAAGKAKSRFLRICDRYRRAQRARPAGGTDGGGAELRGEAAL